MRLDYIPDPPNFKDPEDQAVVERVLQRRGDKGLIALDRTLLHSPPVADGWNAFLGAIRTRTSLPTSIRETAICRVAVLNKAWYEWEAHSPILESAPDVSKAQVLATLNSPPHAPDTTALDGPHATVVAYADAMTLTVQVPDAVFVGLKKHFSDREVVEITTTVASYNCVSRVLVALDVGERNSQTGPKEGGKE
ncbi:hypothetical protein NX059_010750 [Plenodomus lindquistii]|nr:hypothetical protein NX059_010750 [Plenodomus lindquistii]